MLCPEVWKFSTHKKDASFQIGNYDAKAKKSIDRTIQNNSFNQMVSIILPRCETLPEPVEELIKTADFYLIKDLRLSELVRKDFIEAFIKRGRLTGVSLDTGISNDFENKFYITPDGKLRILICKDLYQILGLEGRAVGQTKDRFEITIDLKNNNFPEQPKLYNRIKNALSNPEIEQFDFQLTWESSKIDSNICPSSIAKFFKDSGYKVEQHSIQTQLSRIDNLRIPNGVFADGHIDSVIAHKIAEYFAFIMLECEMDFAEELNSYQPTFNLNFDNQKSKECVVMHCKGLMSSDFVANLLAVLRPPSTDSEFVILNVNSEQVLSHQANTGLAFICLNHRKYFVYTA
ncbi:ribonuclease P protein subunit p40-like isoform X2 [Eupeodes corollae]|uniref:ribonuclease P protein subunit p40-like isoform X2 n=1 Tax=Eupeodes corollae TaxID=290404 RepID=UPI0024910F7B|nr:ribonuclease P protein subunit p40-like isoform X2 [Eupeodes corollae]